jgi:hypothetical protein
MSCITYRRADYDRIKTEGFVFNLPPETINAIKKIATNVGAPEYIRTPHFEKPRMHKSRLPPIEITDTDWDTLRMFKATQLEKKKGVELSIDKIRKHLNKMTTKTYETLKTQIIDEIELILQAAVGDNAELINELNKIGEAVFDIASGNSFYSSMYATLYNVLMTKYEFFKTIFTDNLNTQTNIFKDFEYCDPNKDYDKFCKNNKTNEKRRALALFYVNLMLQNIIPVEKIAGMLDDIQVDMLGYIKKENNVNIVDEISELVYIFITNGANKLKTLTDEWAVIGERINRISALKPKAEPSISNKTIFKHMDMQAYIK